MNKINFQNGTLVSKAKVTINGTVYEVEPAEYEGTTPLNAENLNQIQTNAENAINEVNNRILGTVLYESNTGTKDNIRLSESTANYNVLEIEYNYQGVYNTTKIYSPNGKKVSLSISNSIPQYDASRTQYKVVEIQGDLISNNQYGYMTISESSTIGANIHENNIYITKIVGY